MTLLRLFGDQMRCSTIEAHIVPKPGEEPGDGMIEFLDGYPNDWDGDDNGINICGVVAGPGDWVVRAGDQWFVLESRFAARLWEITEMMRCDEGMSA